MDKIIKVYELDLNVLLKKRYIAYALPVDTTLLEIKSHDDLDKITITIGYGAEGFRVGGTISAPKFSEIILKCYTGEIAYIDDNEFYITTIRQFGKPATIITYIPQKET